MAGKDDFSVEEWDLLRQAPLMASLMIVAASPSGPLGLAKEFSAASHVILEAAEKAKTPLVQAVSQDLKEVVSWPRVQEGSDPGRVQDLALNALKRAATVLRAKATPEEAGEFKQWLTAIAQQTAEAAKEGGFLGAGGVLVSDQEMTALAAIRSVLNGRAA